jgi:YcxB-like protein
MKLEYAISFDDFRSLQAPYAVKPGRNVGFRAALAVCGAMALLGAATTLQGFGLTMGLFLIGLGAAGAGAAYFFDLRSVKNGAQKYEDAIARAYQQIHCRDRRIVDVGEAGFATQCACGTVSRPWSELKSFSENDPFFVLRTKSDAIPVAKSAFRSEGDRTEFRSLVLDKLNRSKPFATRPIEFKYVPADFRSAALLHGIHGGGWHRWLSLTVRVASFSYLVFLLIRSQSTSLHDAAVQCYFAFGTVLLFVLVRFLMKKKARYSGPLRLTFGPDGLYLQDPQTIAVTGWDNFIGYLESPNAFLIYSSPKIYRIVPKRILGDREKEFASLLQSKLPVYNYKRPSVPVRATASSTPN